MVIKRRRWSKKKYDSIWLIHTHSNRTTHGTSGLLLLPLIPQMQRLNAPTSKMMCRASRIWSMTWKCNLLLLFISLNVRYLRHIGLKPLMLYVCLWCNVVTFQPIVHVHASTQEYGQLYIYALGNTVYPECVSPRDTPLVVFQLHTISLQVRLMECVSLL